MNESGLKLRINVNTKHLLTVSLVVLLSACTNQNSDVPIQSNGDGYSEYQNQQINNQSITNTEALAIGAVGVGTGYAVGKYANKPRYSNPRTVYGKPEASYGKPVVVVNKHYYQTKPKVRALLYKRK